VTSSHGPSHAAAAPRGAAAVCLAAVEPGRVTGLYRGTAVRGPGDAAGPSGELLISNCADAHVYALAPLRCAQTDEDELLDQRAAT
jgi:hypothetical protein